MAEQEIVHRLSQKLTSYNVHDLSYQVPCYYKLIFIKKTSRRGTFSISDERYVPAKHVEFILGRRKSGSSDEFRTGFSPSEFQEALKKCEAGSPDLGNENLKRRIFLDYATMTNRFISFLHIT